MNIYVFKLKVIKGKTDILKFILNGFHQEVDLSFDGLNLDSRLVFLKI